MFYRLSSLTEDLYRLKAEREDLKQRLEAAERRIRECQDDADKEKKQSTEIDKLKRELDRTGRELDEAKLRYKEYV